MLPMNSPETPAAMQARLTYLRNRKRVLDELIVCLERYSADAIPPPRRFPTRACGRTRARGEVRRVAGAA